MKKRVSRGSNTARPQAEPMQQMRPQRLQGHTQRDCKAWLTFIDTLFVKQQQLLFVKNTMHVTRWFLTVSPKSTATFTNKCFVRWNGVSKIYSYFSHSDFSVGYLRFLQICCYFSYKQFIDGTLTPCSLFGLGLWPSILCDLICCMGSVVTPLNRVLHIYFDFLIVVEIQRKMKIPCNTGYLRCLQICRYFSK